MGEIVKSHETLAYATIALGYFLILGLVVASKIAKQNSNAL